MKTLSKLFLLWIFSLIVIIGCTNSGRPPDPQKTAGPAKIDVTTFVSGQTYTSECLSSDIEAGGIKLSSKQTVYFEQDDEFKNTEMLSAVEGDCRNISVMIEESGQVIESDNNLKPHRADLNFESLSITLKNELVVAAFNQAQTCGFSDWEKDVAKEVIELTTDCLGRGSPRSEVKVLDLTPVSPR